MGRHVFSTLMADSEASTRSGAIPGLRFAEVVAIEEEGYILEWLSGGVRSRSAPARAASFMAGHQRGAYFPFEIGDEVVVGFEEGHLDQPIVLGALWSDEDPLPPDVDASDSNNTRSIVSREGHSLTFDDSPGSTVLSLTSAGGLEIMLDDSAQKLTIKFDNDNKIELSAEGIKVIGQRIDLN